MVERGVSETVCPLCSTPRPRGVKRCRCNYTFEYDAPMRPGRLVSPRRTSNLGVAIVACAVIAALVAGFFASGVHQKPDDVMSMVLLGAGLFALLGALGGWSWFLDNSRARRVVWMFGAAGARVFYALIGGALSGASISWLVAV